MKNAIVSKHGDIPWPPRSPDLTVPDFFLWGYMKDNIFRMKPASVKELKKRIEEDIRSISKSSLESIMNGLPNRMADCVKCKGEHLKKM